MGQPIIQSGYCLLKTLIGDLDNKISENQSGKEPEVFRIGFKGGGLSAQPLTSHKSSIDNLSF